MNASSSVHATSRSATWLLVSVLAGCGGTLDAGWNDSPQLPVDERDPILLVNDGFEDNWQGEYAMLLASSRHSPLAGIIVNAGGNWPDLEANLVGWQQMVSAAREGGLGDIPDPIASDSPQLNRPEDGDIDSTSANRSAGAQLIVDTAKRLGKPQRPLVIATGGRLTDVADAYLMDPALTERVVVVSSLGSGSEEGGVMGIPNGEQDPWASVIVAERFRYLQVSAFYDQNEDVASSELERLPANAFATWMAEKHSTIWDLPQAADQVSVLAVAVPGFVASAIHVVEDGETPEGYPRLAPETDGPAWLVTEIDSHLPRATLWELLLDPTTFPEAGSSSAD